MAAIDTILYEKTDTGEYTDQAPPNILNRAEKIDLNLVSVDYATGGVSYVIPPNPKITKGVPALLQRIIKSILTIRGTNAWELKFGSNFAGIYSALSISEVEDAKTSFPLYLKSIVRNLREEDNTFIANGGEIAPTQRLEDITLEAINYDETFNGWLITLRVTTFASGAFIFNIP